MISNEIEINVKRIFENFSKEDFIFDLLLAYGISKTSITRLKNGDFNLSKTKGEILYKKKVFFKQEATGSLLITIDSISKDERILSINQGLPLLPFAGLYIRHGAFGILV
ncbi:hypothetical protein BH20BAC1_BH20BAC1_26140 [soil metagenome]